VNRARNMALWLAISCLLAAGAAAQELRVTLLGTGTPRPLMERFGASILVEAGGEKMVFDCGRGCTQRLYQMKVPLAEVNHLFLTHLHSDHTTGIPDLWLTGWIFERKQPFEVIGPKGTKEMMQGLEKAYAFDIHTRRDVDEKFSAEGVRVIARDVGEGVVYEKNGVKVTAFLVDHGPVKPAFGYRIDYNGRSVVLSGDTRPSENLVKHAQGVDLLVHEVYAEPAGAQIDAIEERIIAHHTTPEQAGEIFTRVKPKLAVYSHIGRGTVTREEIIRGTRKTYSGPLEVGEDLMVIEVGKEVKVVGHF